MVRLKEVAKMDRGTREYLDRKLKERREELAIVKKALKELKEELEYDGKVEWKSVNAKELADKQAYKDIYDGDDWSVEKNLYFVIYKNGKVKEVPIGNYHRDSAYEGEYPVSWKKDVYVGDFLTEDAIAVISYYECVITFRNYENYEMTVYLLEANKGELKELLLEKVRQIDDVGKILELLARL